MAVLAYIQSRKPDIPSSNKEKDSRKAIVILVKESLAPLGSSSVKQEEPQGKGAEDKAECALPDPQWSTYCDIVMIGELFESLKDVEDDLDLVSDPEDVNDTVFYRY